LVEAASLGTPLFIRAELGQPYEDLPRLKVEYLDAQALPDGPTLGDGWNRTRSGAIIGIVEQAIESGEPADSGTGVLAQQPSREATGAR